MGLVLRAQGTLAPEPAMRYDERASAPANRHQFFSEATDGGTAARTGDGFG